MDDIFQNIKVYGTKELLISNSKRLCYLIKCDYCHNLHYKAQCEILKGLDRNKRFFCSRECLAKDQTTKMNVICATCGKEFQKLPKEIAKSKSGNNFCSKSCAAIFNNRNKKHGTRRSKLECFLEEQIKTIFPTLELACNSKETVGSELDFYFPTLKLAIQINGPLHFQPIYGQEKLDRIQILDNEKRDRCEVLGIRLVEIDCQNDKYLNKNLKNERWKQVQTILEEGVSPDLNALTGTTRFPSEVGPRPIHLPI